MLELTGGGRLVLASASPRRAELLRSVGFDPDVLPADIDEAALPGEPPAAYVARLSAEKARVVAERWRFERPDLDAIVVAADTTVDVDGLILEKPADEADARRMLGLLSGRVHQVHTGVTGLVVTASSGLVPDPATVVVETAVEFVELTPGMVEWYVGTGEPFDKAGGYAIQGAGAALVRRVEGSVSNVIGLPLADTLDLVRSLR